MKNRKLKFVARNKANLRLKPVMLAMAAIFPCQVMASIVVDTNEERKLNVGAAANGTPLININDPNNKGISHNKYADFNVGQQGIIFNNSMQDGVSATGGFVIKNNQLSSEAQVILNEVTGAKGSHLAGSMEVFGRRADLIVANENGITVNGVSTVNANNLTLSTGRVNFDQAGNIQLAVERGNVAVEGTGINTDGLSYFDIVSRSATLSGEIAGTADVKIVTGLNDYDTASRTHSVRSLTGNDTPKVAISGTNLGSMYGNRIQLISTESGAGVTHEGSIVGSQGIEITADGEINLAATVSKNGNIEIAGKSITLQNNASTGVGGLSAQGDVILQALAQLDLKSNVIAETGIIRINAGSLLQSAASLVAKSGARTSSAIPSIQINVADRYVISGTLYAVDSHGNRIEGAQVVLSKGKYVVKVGAQTIDNAIVMSDARLTSLNGDITITAGMLENNQAVLAAQKGSLIFNLTDSLVNNGTVQANGSIELKGRRLKNGGIFATTDDLKLTLGTVENTGSMYAERVTITTDELTNTGETALISADQMTLDGTTAGKLVVSNSDGATIQSTEGDLTLSHIDSLNNRNATIIAKGALKVSNADKVINDNGKLAGENISIENVNTLENKEGKIAANKEISINNIKKVLNELGAIYAYGDIKFTGVDLLTNSNKSVISSLNGSLYFSTLENLKNISGSVLEAAGMIVASDIGLLQNSSDATLQSMGGVSLENIQTVENAGGILTSLSLIMNNINSLVNKGELANLQALDIIISKVASVVNQNNAYILAENILKLTEINSLLNEAASLIQADNLSISAKEITNTGYESTIFGIDELSVKADKVNNSDQAVIVSDNNLSITADVIDNGTEAQISAVNYNLEASSLKNSGVIVSEDVYGDSVIKVTSLDNKSGAISNMGSLEISATDIKNEDGYVFGGWSLILNKEGDFSNAEGTMISSNNLNINATGNVSIDKAMESFGTVNISGKNIYNNESIVSANNIVITGVKIVNNINSLIYSMGNTILKASDAIINMLRGNILSQQQMVMEAGTIHNQAGVIRSEGNMFLDAANIYNESTYKGESWDYSSYQTGKKTREEGNNLTWGKTHSVYISLPGLSSDIALDVQAEISSGANLYINQDSETPAIVKNEGGLIQAKDNVMVRGDLYNSSKSSSINMLEYLKNPLQDKIALYFYHWQASWEKEVNLVFDTFYDMLNYLYGNGADRDGNYEQVDSSSRMKYDLTIKDLASSHALLNEMMNKMFGEQWKATDHSYMIQRWGELVKGSGESVGSSGAGEGGASREISLLEKMKIYFLPAEKASIVAGKNFVHTGGSFNNGIAPEMADGAMENKVVNVEIGEEQVSTLEQGYEVKVNKKNISEISMGISTLPTIATLTEIKGLFEKSQAFIDHLASIASTSSVNSDTGATHTVIPMYETRLPMIDQSKYYGSDYFFNSIGYNSSQPTIVIGDNYFVSELIRRQLNESTGSFFAVKYNVEGADLVKMMLDNTIELVSSEAGADFVTGQPLTQDQIANLKQDIVWFVTESIDGVDVMVPRIYLASNTIEEVKTYNETGSAAIHAGNNVVVDAENINNINGSISSGNDTWLMAEGDINNISSGMNAGITAGGSATMVSKSGDITNSGSGLKAGKDINMYAEEGDVKIIASVGRDEDGNQKIGAYNDGLNAKGNINIKAKQVDITGIEITGGEKEDNVIRVTATEGNVNFNDVHEVNSSYSYDYQTNGILTTRTEEVTESSAKAKANTVKTGGAFIVDAAQDAVFAGGEYNASSGAIMAGNDVITKTSQDHSYKERKVTESSLEFGYKTDVPGLGASETTHSSLDGVDTKEAEYNSQGPEGNMSNSNTKRPGAAATADTASFKAGLKTKETVTRDSKITNKNANFNFTNGVDIEAGNTLDIGGMDLTVGDSATASLSAENIISTKYEDVNKSSTEVKETFSGIKGEVHSSLIDAYNKTDNLIDKSLNQDMEVDALMTAVEMGGNVSNVMLNDLAGGSVSAGWSQKTEKTETETRTENVNKFYGGQFIFNSKKDTTLTGVDIKADQVDIDVGGDFSMAAAKSRTTESTSTSSHNVSLAGSGGGGPTGAGAGVSVDYSGSTSQRDIDATLYSNSSIDANSVHVKVKGNMEMKGANIKAETADVNVDGDLKIASMQDTYRETASSGEWGGSVGVAITSKGILPTAAVSGGGGSEEHSSNVTNKQSGITATGKVIIKAGGDLNMTGAHVISENQTGSIDVGGVINSQELVDNIDSSGTYGGGGFGMSYKGTPTGNFYVDTLDEVHKKEQQHNTINLDLSGNNVKGDINADIDKKSTVTQDDKKAGNNISYTIGVPSKKKSKKADNGADIKKPTDNNATNPSHTVTPGSGNNSAFVRPGNGGNATVRPGSGNGSTPQKPGNSTPANKPSHTIDSGNSNNSAKQRPGSGGLSTQQPDISRPASKPSHTIDSGNSGNVVKQKPGSNNSASVEPGRPSTDPAGPNSSKPAKKWPTVEPAKPIVGGPGSSSRPEGGNFSNSVKPANNSPAYQRPDNNSANVKPGRPSANAGTADSTTPAKKWPTVQPAKPIVGGPGSSSRPDGGNFANSVKPANGSPAHDGADAGKWKVLMDNQTIEKPIK
ncbi:hemagglutinin repeat-containing protein [Erwinia phyllosphaerae]|uniref:two-partner secretion domain-containing protein n=1 Tax=Erwinia phyllosphaerae TaxID=2853256 RepID=UPI001FEE977D|nr:hemagglutinin repeat-containing protein [Erwinia phyllosphaerae]MBV4368048.1 hemagglutinin repeat-containing protein [Erwinia phyllosphaerae]